MAVELELELELEAFMRWEEGVETADGGFEGDLGVEEGGGRVGDGMGGWAGRAEGCYMLEVLVRTGGERVFEWDWAWRLRLRLRSELILFEYSWFSWEGKGVGLLVCNSCDLGWADTGIIFDREFC